MVPNKHTVSGTCPPAPPPNIEMPRLTARQQQILDWIRGHMEATGMPPTRAEIAAGLGFSTASSAEDHLQALARKGAHRIHARRRARLALARHARRARPRDAAARGPRRRRQPDPRRRAHRSAIPHRRRAVHAARRLPAARQGREHAGCRHPRRRPPRRAQDRRRAQRPDRRRAPGRGSHRQTTETSRA